MSFKLPFSFQSIQESLNLNLINQSLRKGKESIQPYTDKTFLMLSTQLSHLQELSGGAASGDTSELPVDYLKLEVQCDLLLKLYGDLIQFSNDTFANVSYDYPPGNYALTKLRESNISGALSNKFNQLKNASTPQELEKVFVGGSEQEEAHVQTISAQIPKTLYGKLSQIAATHGEELKEANSPLSLALLHFSSTYLEIAGARLSMDQKISSQVGDHLVRLLNEQFIKVNDLRKSVYTKKLELDTARGNYKEGDDKIVEKEDELVSAIESTVTEMKKLLSPTTNISWIKIFAEAQKEWFEIGQKKLAGLLENLEKIDLEEDE